MTASPNARRLAAAARLALDILDDLQNPDAGQLRAKLATVNG